MPRTVGILLIMTGTCLASDFSLSSKLAKCKTVQHKSDTYRMKSVPTFSGFKESLLAISPVSYVIISSWKFTRTSKYSIKCETKTFQYKIPAEHSGHDGTASKYNELRCHAKVL